MVKIISRKFPNVRVHVGGSNVKFKDGAADVSDETAEALLSIEHLELALETEDAYEPNADEGADRESAEDVSDETAEALLSIDEPFVSAKRGPGRPKKTEE